MLKVNLMGMTLDNPVVVASGPWSRGREKMKLAMECGAGAVITESIVSEHYPDTCPRYSYNPVNRGLQNIRLYSGLGLESWLKEFRYLESVNRYGSSTKLIVSVMGTSPSETRYIARKIEQTGVDGIEIGLACPMGEGPEIIAGSPQKVYEYTKAVVNGISIPVSVKLSANTGNLPLVVDAVERAGAVAVSAIDTLRCILKVDTETGEPALPTYGGYSGAPIKPIGLATVAGIVQSTSLPVIGMGGIENCDNLLEYIMVGATAAGIGTAILLNGYGIVSHMVNELDSWREKHHLSSLEKIRGTSLSKLKSFEEIKITMKKAKYTGSFDLENPCFSCGKCESLCPEKAISFIPHGKSIIPSVESMKCSGCGLCVSICPDNILKLSWK